MKLNIYIWLLVSSVIFSCQKETKELKHNSHTITAKEILGNPEYVAISYGGYRAKSRDIQPTLDELKEDMKLLAAMGIKVIRSYNLQFPHASNILNAIRALKEEDDSFEMYVMLGAWIDCKDAWTDNPDHTQEALEANTIEINKAVTLANEYPEVVKILAVGNEAMVHWAWSYWVEPTVILKWVNHLQELKTSGALPKDLWITSSDNFASWGGGDKSYHKDDLIELINAVDYISMHTYPLHDTHYNPVFWGIEEEEEQLSKLEQIDKAMNRAKNYAIQQYQSVKNYLDSLGVEKPIHIGETGWSTFSSGYYGHKGSKATDEYKQAIYYKHMREWTNRAGISCFYFEAFDEIWKDALNPKGSENHFGLFTVDGKAKYALWELVDANVFEGLGRNGQSVSKTYNGNFDALMKDVKLPPLLKPVNAE